MHNYFQIRVEKSRKSSCLLPERQSCLFFTTEVSALEKACNEVRREYKDLVRQEGTEA